MRHTHQARESDTISDAAFKRAVAKTRRQYKQAFKMLAAYDRGEWTPKPRKITDR
jgi:hypothetical protein